MRPGFVGRAIEVIESNGGTVEFVALVCPLNELRGRMNAPSRTEYGKLTSLELFDQLHAGGVFDTSAMPKPLIKIDTSLMSPAEAAEKIAGALGIG